VRELVALSAAASNVSVRTAMDYKDLAKTFDRFTSAYGVDGGPDPRLIAAFVLASRRVGFKLVSIRNILSALRWRYSQFGDVTGTARQTLARLRQLSGVDPTSRAAAIPRGGLLAMVSAARTGPPNAPMRELTTARDVARLATGVAGYLRPGEQSCARIERLVRHPESYYLSIVESKTGKLHERAEGVWLTRRSDDLDPVGALDHYLGVLVHGHEKVPAGGQMRSPFVATRSPRWWPAEVPTPR